MEAIIFDYCNSFRVAAISEIEITIDAICPLVPNTKGS